MSSHSKILENTHVSDVRVFDSRAAMACHVFEMMAALEGEAHIALSGGSMLDTLFLQSEGPDWRALDWDRFTFWQVDERFVPMDDPANSFARMKAIFADQGLEVPDRAFEPVDTASFDTPEASAAAYEARIKHAVPCNDADVPQFSLMLLGMGADGHTASLFPGQPVLENMEECVSVCERPDGRVGVTLTFPVINAASARVFMITGEGKAEALRRVIQRAKPLLPAARVENAAFYLDETAYKTTTLSL